MKITHEAATADDDLAPSPIGEDVATGPPALALDAGADPRLLAARTSC